TEHQRKRLLQAFRCTLIEMIFHPKGLPVLVKFLAHLRRYAYCAHKNYWAGLNKEKNGGVPFGQ
ncbi:MAG TPA: hypothetical protein PLC40_13100, partial [Candidatus Hydrogenedentes bacterium]|nr:hypothetical protein [Candidatus Hydrogenedentota bacterium]